MTQYKKVYVETTVTDANAKKMDAVLSTVDENLAVKNWAHDAVGEFKGRAALGATGLATIDVPTEIANSGVGLIICPTIDFAGNITINKVILEK